MSLRHGYPTAKKALGQHFLVDPNLQRKIVGALEPGSADHVVEIGPGTGALTWHLLGQVGRLTLVELDDGLAARLRDDYADHDEVAVVHGDALELSFAELTDGAPFKVIGNIPYGITTPLIFHLLEQSPRPERIVLTVQREVADRLVARPGGKEYGALTVGVQAVAAVETLFPVSREVFRPRPDVDSTAVRIVPTLPPPLAPPLQAAFRQLTRAAFSRRRKQIQTVLRQAPEYALTAATARSTLRALEIDPAARPDALSVSDYLRLAETLAARG